MLRSATALVLIAVGEALTPLRVWRVLDPVLDPFSDEYKFLESVTAEWEQRPENRGWRVEHTAGDRDTGVFLMQALTELRRGGIDVLAIDAVHVETIMGYLHDLSASIPLSRIANFDSSGLPQVHGNGLVGLPYFTDVGVLVGRVDLLKKHGLEWPKRWSDLERVSRIIMQRENIWGYAWQGAKYEGLVCNVVEWTQSHRAAEFVGADWCANVDSPEVKEAVKRAHSWLGNISSPECLKWKEQESLDAFLRNETVFLRTWPTFGYAAKMAMGDKVGLGLLPGQFSGSRTGAVGGWYLTVAENSPNRAAAVSFLNHMLSESVQRRLLDIGKLPGQDHILTDLYPSCITDSPAWWCSLPRFPSNYRKHRPRSRSYSDLSAMFQSDFHNLLEAKPISDELVNTTLAALGPKLQAHLERHGMHCGGGHGQPDSKLLLLLVLAGCTIVIVLAVWLAVRVWGKQRLRMPSAAPVDQELVSLPRFVQKQCFLGGGTFGKVYRGMDVRTGWFMAVKEIKVLQESDEKGHGLDEKAVQRCRQEYDQLCRVRHRNIVESYHFHVDEDRGFAVIYMELMPQRSLADQVKNYFATSGMPELLVAKYTSDLLTGLDHVHGHGILHRDVKPPNMLIDNQCLKIGDFGLCTTRKRGFTHLVGTVQYLSPRAAKGEYSFASDLFAVGGTIVFMCTANDPFPAFDRSSTVQLVEHIRAGNLPNLPQMTHGGPVSEDCTEFLVTCFDEKRNCAQRMQQGLCAAMLVHPFLQEKRPTDTCVPLERDSPCSTAVSGDPRAAPMIGNSPGDMLLRKTYSDDFMQQLTNLAGHTFTSLPHKVDILERVEHMLVGVCDVGTRAGAPDYCALYMSLKLLAALFLTSPTGSRAYELRTNRLSPVWEQSAKLSDRMRSMRQGMSRAGGIYHLLSAVIDGLDLVRIACSNEAGIAAVDRLTTQVEVSNGLVTGAAPLPVGTGALLFTTFTDLLLPRQAETEYIGALIRDVDELVCSPQYGTPQHVAIVWASLEHLLQRILTNPGNARLATAAYFGGDDEGFGIRSSLVDSRYTHLDWSIKEKSVECCVTLVHAATEPPIHEAILVDIKERIADHLRQRPGSRKRTDLVLASLSEAHRLGFVFRCRHICDWSPVRYSHDQRPLQDLYELGDKSHAVVSAMQDKSSGSPEFLMPGQAHASS
eukprot:TRINITY_DN43374_c0_g1_i1.p1 TRINITY_DN43374_c0_g1~~TRINITY_DN43374_c0_g1_i1.p1  ORF type:complete len:1191 (+),score=313.27 TRINITY_DN43374_c0_g1_i1:59-3574(+)